MQRTQYVHQTVLVLEKGPAAMSAEVLELYADWF